MKERSAEEVGKISRYLTFRAMRTFGGNLLASPMDLAAIRSGCLADYLLGLIENSRRSIARLGAAPVTPDIDEDWAEAATRVQPIWIFLDTLRTASKLEQDNNVSRHRPTTSLARSIFSSVERDGRAYLGKFLRHELEVLSDLRHWGAHYGGAPGIRWSTATRLSDLRFLHRKTDEALFKISRCPNCDGWWELDSLLRIARDELERLDRPLREIREVFDSDIWKRYAGGWEKVRALEMFPPRPSIFQLNEVLAAAREKA